MTDAMTDKTAPAAAPAPASPGAAGPEPAPNPPTGRHMTGELGVQEWVLVGVLVALAVVGALVNDRFLTGDNLLTILTQASVVGVVAVGMTFVITTGGIDLSVGSGLAAASIAGGVLSQWGPLEGVDSLAFVVGAIAFGCLIGAVNATAITVGRVVPFIATLAMFTAARGTALWMSDKTPISTASLDQVRWFGNGDVLGVPVPVVVLLLVVVAGWVLLNRTAFGRHVVAVGGNREAARISGVRVQRTTFVVYVLSGLCTGIAALLLSGRLASASPVSGNLLELDAIAAVVIGGTSLSGGKASMLGTFLGVLTFAVIFNLLALLSLPSEIQQIVKGAIIVAAVVLQRRDH